VLDGARVSAAAPRSAAVARTRRAMREAVAARPGLVLMTGDLVRRGTSADLALARRLIREELEGKVDWRYVPGDGEVGPGGDLTAFRREFGNPVQVLDRAGTRIVLLNSAQGSFRVGGFQQLVRLRSALAGARRDRTISSVVVVAHHPTGDPMPGSDAELTDPREAELVEQLLADFRATSGKAVSYVGGHARRSATTRHDGVEQVLAGPVNAPDRRARGGFAGWSLLRADASGLRVEFRASVNRLRVLAPARLAVGTSAAASAVVFQTGRRVPVEYPMNARWLETPTVHVGPPADAPASAVLSYVPDTARVTALKPGEADLTVEVNGRRARRTVSVG
jgi:3',5'-cyclic AMP phosphodiesterase CpdA